MTETSTQSREIAVTATVSIVGDDAAVDAAIERVTGPGGDEWRQQAYNLHTEKDVLQHWAHNAVANCVVDLCQLDGWADVQAETVTFVVEDVLLDD